MTKGKESYIRSHVRWKGGRVSNEKGDLAYPKGYKMTHLWLAKKGDPGAWVTDDELDGRGCLWERSA